MSFTYLVHLGAWPLLIGQGMPLPIYARNLWLIYRERQRRRTGEPPPPPRRRTEGRI
jgi:lipid-A-disaccharide synthase-like uncharacterized protein